ncbi:MAG: hypothetical protein ABI700_25925 [Chloroflexota bacterium]
MSNEKVLVASAAAESAEVTAPIIVSLGKKKRKAIKQLKRGKGSVMTEVMDVIDQVQETLGTQAEGKILVPVVVIYQRKERRFRGLF